LEIIKQGREQSEDIVKIYHDISSSKNLYIETILKFPNYHWSPHGITQNPNIQKNDVLMNPKLPWIYTDVIQDWVDEDWINSFPYYNEKIITKLNILPNFVRQKIIKGIPISYTFSDLVVIQLDSKNKTDDMIKETNCNVLIDHTTFDFEHTKLNVFCIFGRSNLLFSFVEQNHDITFYFDKDVLFVNEITYH
jgi:hypothetical protein